MSIGYSHLQKLINCLKLYEKWGFAVIPLFPSTKEPCVRHDIYHEQGVPKKMIKEWLKTYWNPEYWHRLWYKFDELNEKELEVRARWIRALERAYNDLINKGYPEDVAKRVHPHHYEYKGELNIAVLGGKASKGLVLVDVEDLSKITVHPSNFIKGIDAIVVKTGKENGYHFYFKCEDFDKNLKGENGEIRCTGYYVVAPPSVHPSGFEYHFVQIVQDFHTSKYFINDYVLKWIGFEEEKIPKVNSTVEKESKPDMVEFEEDDDSAFIESLCKIPVEVGKRSDWTFVATYYFKLKGYSPEEAFKKIITIPCCNSKIFRDGAWDYDRGYEWWLKYEWEDIENPTLEGFLGAISKAEEETGFKLDYRPKVKKVEKTGIWIPLKWKNKDFGFLHVEPLDMSNLLISIVKNGKTLLSPTKVKADFILSETKRDKIFKNIKKELGSDYEFWISTLRNRLYSKLYEYFKDPRKILYSEYIQRLETYDNLDLKVISGSIGCGNPGEYLICLPIQVESVIFKKKDLGITEQNSPIFLSRDNIHYTPLIQGGNIYIVLSKNGVDVGFSTTLIANRQNLPSYIFISDPPVYLNWLKLLRLLQSIRHYLESGYKNIEDFYYGWFYSGGDRVEQNCNGEDSKKNKRKESVEILRERGEQIVELLKKYIYFDDKRLYYIVACWIIGTYMFPIFSYYPYLIIRGEKGSGKGTLLTFLSKTCWNPTSKVVDPSRSSIFRLIECARPTYIIDEYHRVIRSEIGEQLAAVLEAGAERDAMVVRTDTESKEVEFFNVYCPKAIASRVELEHEDKGITIIMEKVNDPKYAKRRKELDLQDFTDLQVELVFLCLITHDKVFEEYMKLEPTAELTGRYYNIFAPILAIAKVVFPNEFDDLLKYAEEQAKTKIEIAWEMENRILGTLYANLNYAEQTEFNGKKTLQILLKDLAEMTGLHHNQVKSALYNLKLVVADRQTSRGKKYYIDVDRLKKLVEDRRIEVETD